MRRRTPPSYWLVVRHESGLMGALTRDIGPERALVVFGFEDEAQVFFMSASLGDGWYIRESTAGELISMLFGPCSYVDAVLLDPPPEDCHSPTPRTVARRRFVDFLADRQMLWRTARANAGGRQIPSTIRTLEGPVAAVGGLEDRLATSWARR